MDLQDDFVEWYSANYSRIEATLVVAAGDADLGHEAASEAFARALERWGRVSAMKNPDGWVYRVGVNVVRRTRHRRKVEREISQGRSAGGDVQPPVTEMGIDLWHAVARLPRQQRTAIALKYIADMTERQVAETMGINIGTVARHLHGARRKLAIVLSDDPTERPQA